MWRRTNGIGGFSCNRASEKPDQTQVSFLPRPLTGEEGSEDLTRELPLVDAADGALGASGTWVMMERFSGVTGGSALLSPLSLVTFLLAAGFFATVLTSFFLVAFATGFFLFFLIVGAVVFAEGFLAFLGGALGARVVLGGGTYGGYGSPPFWRRLNALRVNTTMMTGLR